MGWSNKKSDGFKFLSDKKIDQIINKYSNDFKDINQNNQNNIKKNDNQ